MIHISETCLSDLFKDAHGFRPRGHYKEWWTQEDLDIEIEYLCDLTKANMALEAVNQAESLRVFEEMIEYTISIGAPDRKTAIRWLMDAEDVDMEFKQDVEHFFWKQGLSFEKIDEYTKEFFEGK